ncbi:retroviral-like aspartic protease family protein [Sphaerospermopsis sp. LEGE 08334]|uniref:retroviral-like aspartic protease family protein n=1 Tax=Sphaerospermopsis sp. LEGE 08334 TaxID=1828651 RepID=UPI0028150A13|nr:retroviral-like aspartic protease family protein [Sphaerospermopsis sp. LEGE 08334]
MITEKMAQTLKLQPSGTMRASIADGSIVEFKTSTVSAIAVGGAVMNNAKVAIAPKAQIGLLGHDFFEKYDIKILANQIEFYPR